MKTNNQMGRGIVRAVLLLLALPLAACGQSNGATPYFFTTLAGSAGNYGSANGTGSAARFNYPIGVALDTNGNVYVADSGNNTIRKVTPAGVVTTLAGLAGSVGSADGTGSAARFYEPDGIAVDANGNLYVADTGNDTIRKITPAGAVTTLAGLAGSFGSADGTGSAARFSYPYGVAVDTNGNVYVADSPNLTIRKITPAGVVTTLAGGTYGNADGTGSAAQFAYPDGVAVDSGGNIYVADTYNDTIREVTPAGVVTTLAGTPGSSGSGNGTGSTVRFASPYGVAVDTSGNVYVADSENYTIRKGIFTPFYVQVTASPTYGNVPQNVQFTAASVDSGSNAVTQWNWDFGDGSTSVLQNPSHTYQTAGFYYPSLLAADNAGNAVGSYPPSITVNYAVPYTFTALAGLAGNFGHADGTGGGAQFGNPYSVAVDTNGNVYVADSYNSTIRKVTPTGVVTTLAGLAGSVGSADGTGTNALFNFPYGVAVDTNGNVYVADSGNNTIRKVTPAGVVTTLAGLAGTTGSADGTGSAARFYAPEGIAVDANGNLYVAEYINNTIRKITPAGVVTTLAGGTYGSADGTGSAARFNYPIGVAVDLSGNVYVGDTDNSTIRKVTPGGVVTTLAGIPGVYGSANGTGLAAQFQDPDGLAVDASGNIYVADGANNQIRKGYFTPFVVQASGSPTNGSVPLTVQFTSASVDSGSNAIVNWNWSFGDGSTSVLQNPSHVYQVGTYYPSLLATNNLGNAVGSSVPFIQVSLPTVQFTASTNIGIVPLVVQFTSTNVDTSGHAITNWAWDFGDGSTSALQNPSHTYTVGGFFIPSLTATNDIGITVIGFGPYI